LQASTSRFYTHLGIVALDLSQELAIPPAIVPEASAPGVVESWVNTHPQSSDAINRPDVSLGILGDALLVYSSLHLVLLDASLELFDDCNAEFSGQIVQSVCDD